MNFKKTMTFFIIFVLLGVYYCTQVNLSEKRQAEEETAKKLFSVTEDDIQEIALKRADEEILLQRREDAWKMLQPVTASADNEAVQQMLTEFVSAEQKKVIVEESSQDKEFGLDTPELMVTAKGKDSDITMQLSFGDQTPTASGYYAKAGETPKVITVDNSVKTGLDKTLFQLRDKTILAFEPAEVKKATFTIKNSEGGEDQAIELEQNAGVWKIVVPKEYPADTTKMGSILSKIHTSKVKAFISEEPDDLSEYGLEQAVTTFTLLIGNDNSRKTLVLGKTNEEEEGIYAKHEDTANVFLVPANITEGFPEQVNDLRDKTLLSFKNADIQSIELTTQNETIVLERKSPEAWKITQPEEFEADSSKVRKLLSDAGLLKAEQFVTDEPEELASYGLATPALSLRLWKIAQETPQQVLLGNPDAGNTGIYAKPGAQNSVVLVKMDALQQLHKTLFDLRYKKILSFERPDVEKIRIEYADVTFLLEKDGDEWKAKEPEEKAITFYKVNNLVYDLEELEFQRKIHEPDEDLNIYGLTQPDVKLTLLENTGKEIATLLIGKSVEEQDIRYVKTSSENSVYAIDPAFIDELPKELKDLAE